MGVHVIQQYVHGEAFCLMSYVSDDGKHGELLWNSRDGITPFVIHSRDGVEMTHVDWQSDVRAPHFRPPPGMRIFVDMDEELAAERARERVEQWWDRPDYPLSARFPDKASAIAAFAKEYLGEVTIIEAPAHPPRKKGPF